MPVDVSMAIKQRLNDLGLEQRDLARAAQVTESYISQLLTRRRLPPAPNRTDIYEKMDKFLKLERGDLARLAGHERVSQLKRDFGDEPAPLFGEVRELILKKCHASRRRAVRAIFEQQPFGELERLVTTTILDLVKKIAREQLENEHWLRTVAKLAGRSYEEMRVVTLDFLETDILRLSPENCIAFIEPMIASWDIDLPTFALELKLNAEVSPVAAARFQFVEQPEAAPTARNPGFAAFARDRSLSGTATHEEMAFLERLTFTARRPTALYFYRELQNLRDPLHFEPNSTR